MTVEEFVEEYKKSKNQKELLSSIIATKYVPIGVKQIAMQSTLDKCIQSGENGVVFVNEFVANINFALAIITIYTNLDIKNSDIDLYNIYDLLQENDLIYKLKGMIGVYEIAELQKKQEDGTVKGEKWSTSQQYSGDWKENKKHGYGIKIYDNKDKYEGYWENDLRNGKGTYWLCIGKNKYRKLEH